MTEDRGAQGPYHAYDNLPVLHAREQQLPLRTPTGPWPWNARVSTTGSRWTTSTARR
ncbi:DUF6420 family protein [Streptomyces griseoluteus]|uniref:DUF6420 family protein n=1 Tax=Streptomyces griseoluteus TaxID=29306 RepID=UPI00368EB014